MKYCKNCDKTKPIDEFYIDNSRKDGHEYRCAECRRAWAKDHPEGRRVWRAEWRQRNLFKDRVRSVNFQARAAGYAEIDPTFTEADRAQMLVYQNGLCYTCLNPNRSPDCLDHDHKTTKVRGLLCHNCNRALGFIGDDADTLLRMHEYVTRLR
jgi:hypothetical protein